MKKFLILLFALLVSVPVVYSQKVSGEAFVGMNVSDMTLYNSKVGFQVGARMEIPLKSLANGVYLNGAFALSLKGAQLDHGREEANINAYYFEIPIHFGYKHQFNSKFALFGEFGPYFAVGSFGKFTVTNGYEKMSVDTFSDFGGVKNFDFGLGFRVGAEIARKVPIALGYDFGLVDISRDEYSIKNTNLYISVGYKF